MAGCSDVTLHSRWRSKRLAEHLLPYVPFLPVIEDRDSDNMHWKIWERGGDIAQN